MVLCPGAAKYPVRRRALLLLPRRVLAFSASRILRFNGDDSLGSFLSIVFTSCVSLLVAAAQRARWVRLRAQGKAA